jgi:hypothetical protein
MTVRDSVNRAATVGERDFATGNRSFARSAPSRSRLYGRCFAAFVVAAAVMALPVLAASATAGDDDDLVEEIPWNALGNQALMDVQNVAANIDVWVFGNRRNGWPQHRLDSLLKMRTEEVARSAGLSEAQKQKLMLAGEGDIRRFMESVEDLKAKYQSGRMEMNAWQRIFQETRPLQTTLHRGLFNNNSLFAKTLAKTLTAEQAVRYQAAEDERRMFQYKALVQMAVFRLTPPLGLSDDQRRRLAKLILDNSRPLRTSGQQDHYLVMVQMSRLPEESLKPLFAPWQWRALQRQLDNVPQMMAILRRNGITLEEEPALHEQPAPAAKQRHREIRPQ